MCFRAMLTRTKKILKETFICKEALFGEFSYVCFCSSCPFSTYTHRQKCRLKRRFYTFGFNFDSVLLWKCLMVLIIATIFFNAWGLEFYRWGSPDKTTPPHTLWKRFLVYPLVYFGSSLVIWTLYGRTFYQIKLISLSKNDYDLSEANNIFENEVSENIVGASSPVSFFASLIVPLFFMGNVFKSETRFS